MELKSFIELPISVVFNIYGKDRPATMIDPAEFAEMELEMVQIGDVDVLHTLNAAEKAELEIQCWEKLHEEQMEAML